MTGRQSDLTEEQRNFTEEQRPVSSFTSRNKRCIILVAVIVVIVVIIAIVVPIAVLKAGESESPKSAGESESPKSDHWCGLHLPEGLNMSAVSGPVIISRRQTCDISGSCWKGAECYQCLDGPNADRIGNVNDIPVCCPQCTRHGLTIAWDSCDCRN